MRHSKEFEEVDIRSTIQPLVDHRIDYGPGFIATDRSPFHEFQDEIGRSSSCDSRGRGNVPSRRLTHHGHTVVRIDTSKGSNISVADSIG